MWLFHSPTDRISSLCQNSTVQHCAQSSSRVGLLANGDYKRSSRIPQLNGTGLEKAVFKNERSARDEYMAFTFSPYQIQNISAANPTEICGKQKCNL